MHINSLFKYWTYRLFAPGVVLRETYDAFRELLVFDSRSHELMADLEELYYQGKKEDFCRITARYHDLSASVEGMVTSLERMAPGSFVILREYYRKFDFYCRFLLAPPAVHCGPPFILPLANTPVRPDLAGGKGAVLTELADILHLPVPAGFVITTNSFHYLLEYNDLRRTINKCLSQIDLTDSDSLARISRELMELICHAEIPPAIDDAILTAYANLTDNLSTNRTGPFRMAVRSSAVAEDGECSFAGQYTTLLGVHREALASAYLTVLASKYTPEALNYRIHCGLSDEETPMAVLVVAMVDAAASGVIYTVDPSGRDSRHLFIHTIRGQGEALVSGRVIPEVILVDRDDSSCRQQEQDETHTGALTKPQLQELAATALRIESHFETPQDIEWVKDMNGAFFFLQSRILQSQTTDIHEKPLVTAAIHETPLLQGGIMAAMGQASGAAWCVDEAHPVEQVPAGAILVIQETLPSHVRVLDRVHGVLAGLGSVAGHFSTVCREFGIPLICGLESKITTITHGQVITMNADNRVVYQGNLLPHLATIPRHQSQQHLPFFRKLRKLLDSITPLHLINPKAREFAPESCRSLHDIIRFTHEQAVRTMFSLGDRLGNRSRHRKKLLSDLPFDIFVVDVGGGLLPETAREETITVDQICSGPFQALWTGLTHPSVHWQDRAHFDWKHFGEMTMADGITSSESADFASYAVLGADYINLIMRFGYHFTLVDALCGEDNSNNYCQFRFAGGGADFSGRMLRLDYIRTLLHKAGFQVETRGDLLDARTSALPIPEMTKHLLTLGRLLGSTRLMDMSLHDDRDVERSVQNFLAEI